jgi:predicted lipoprotein with Yx(FWY)xxD motif
MKRALTATRLLGALSLLAVGIDHIDQYYADYYRAVPTIGTLFLLNFISALIVGLALLAPLGRFGTRARDRLHTILALGGIGIGAGTLAGLLVSENGGLFGFMEVGYRSAIVLSIAFDVATVVFLTAFLALRARPSRRRRGPTLVVGGTLLAALVIAGCGGGSSGSAASTPKAAAAAPKPGGAPLQVTTNPKLGKILVDAKGRTLYDFVIDKGTMSVCYGACASLWPPYTTNGEPVAGPGVSKGLIGTAKRKDGTTEVTYAGHPLYYYAPDVKRGQISGQALNQFGAPWYVLAPDGREVHTPGS